jgi:predicted glycoside hydrolase/deacetylase ChbG (UPF0249 family)
MDRLTVGVTELMCHPGYSDGLEGSIYQAEREMELEVLTDPNIHKIITEKGIELISFADLT